MSSAEFALHWAEYRENPWGEQRDQLHAASVIQAIGNYAGKVRTEAHGNLDLATVNAGFSYEMHKTLNPPVETPEPTGPDPESFFKQFSL